jgi:hypothetical protein
MHAADVNLAPRVEDMIRRWGLMIPPDLVTIADIGLVSFDYEAATDLLTCDAARVTFGFIQGDDPTEYMELCSRTLYGEREISYKFSDDSKESIRGRNSQPMGNLWSFPILCSTNLSVYREAVRQFGEEELPFPCAINVFERRKLCRILRRINPLINGDDILFVAPRSFYQLFSLVASEANLIKSVGKAYFSKRYGLMNSQLFENLDYDFMPFGMARVVQHGYLNQGLSTYGKGSGRDGEVLSPAEVSETFNRQVSLVPWTFGNIPSLVGREEWKVNGKSFFSRDNWYLPICLGGLGFNVLPGYSFPITKEQRLLAAYRVNYPNYRPYRRSNGMKIAKIFPGLIPKEVFVPYGGNSDLIDISLTPEEDSENPWKDRLQSIYNFSLKTRGVPDIRLLFNRRPKRDWRLSPMSDETIERYRHGRYFVSSGPMCPPLPSLRF